MASTPRRVFASQPATQRGRGVLIGWHEPSQVISYCCGKSVIIRSLTDPRDCVIYTEHSYPTTVARISPNGEWVASADVSGMVRVWGRHGEMRLRNELKAINGAIDDLQWSGDGQRILVCGDGKPTSVRAFTWDSGGNLGEFDGHHKRVLSCAFRPARPFRVFTCGEDFQVNYYEGPPFRFKASNKDHSNYANCVRFSPDGSLVVSVGSDKQCLLFDGKTGARTGAFSSQGGHAGTVYAAAWSPDGKQVLTVSADKTAKIWDVSSDGSIGSVSCTFALGTQVANMQVGCAWVGPHLLSLSLNGDIHFLSASSPSAPLRSLLGHSKPITAAAVVQADDAGGAWQVVTASYDGSVLRWGEQEGALGRAEQQGGEADGKGGSVSATSSSSSSSSSVGVVALAVSGSKLLLAGADDTIRTLALPSLSPLPDCPPFAIKSQPKDICVAAADPDLALVAAADGVLLIRGNALLSSLTPPSPAIAAALSPDGKEAAVGGEDGVVRLFAVQGDLLSETCVLERHRGPITCLRYSPDGSMLASGDANREAVVWDVVSREVKLKNLVYHTARITSLAWSPDSCLVATGSLDTSVIVYDVSRPPSERVTFKGAHVGGVSEVAFADRSTLVSVGHDACLRMWDMK